MVHVLPKRGTSASGPCALCPQLRDRGSIAPFAPPSFVFSKAAWTTLPFSFSSICSAALFIPDSQLFHSLGSRRVAIQNGSETDLDFSLSSAACLLCDSGQVA